MIQQTDYKSILRLEFDSRVSRNPRYSLRAFARDIQMSPSRLSEVMNGGEGLSRILAKKISEALGYSGPEAQYFCDLVDARHARSEHRRRSALDRLEQSQTNPELYHFTDDEFRMIGDWYHLAILELMNLASFEHDVDWIVGKLNIEATDVQGALDRLERLGLIHCGDDELTLVKGQTTQVGAGVAPEAMKKFHRQILALAADALDQPREEREFGALLVSIDSQRLGEFKERLREFRKSLQDLANKDENRNEVYVCSMQFFRATATAPTGKAEQKDSGKTLH